MCYYLVVITLLKKMAQKLEALISYNGKMDGAQELEV